MEGFSSCSRTLAALIVSGGVLVACGLSATGTGGADESGDGAQTDDASGLISPDGNASPLDDALAPNGSSEASADASLDATTSDTSSVVPKCPATTSDAFSLTTFVEKGTAKNITSSIELTTDANNQAGAAWYESAFTAAPMSIQASFSFTEAGGADNSIDGGFAVAFLAANPPQTLPNVGNAGTSFGVCGIGATGFAVVVDVAHNTSGGNGDSLKIVDVSNCNMITGANFSGVNSNTAYKLVINFSGDKVSVAFAGANINNATVTVPSPMFFGVTASTGNQPSNWLFSGATGTFTGCP